MSLEVIKFKIKKVELKSREVGSKKKVIKF